MGSAPGSRMTVAEAVLWIAFGERQSPDISKRLDPIQALLMSGNEQTDEEWKAADEASESVNSALAELNAKAREGVVRVEGRPFNGLGKPTSIPHEPIKPTFFLTSEILFDATTLEYMAHIGEVTNASRVRFHDLVFDAGQILTAWPHSGQETSVKSDNDAQMLSYMLAEGEAILSKHKAKPKRDDLVTVCIANFNCRHEDAERVHAMLPDHLRRTRGERR